MSVNMERVERIKYVSLCSTLFGVCLMLCRYHGYMHTPTWLILCIVLPPALFWGLALTLAFIVWCVWVIRETDREIREKNKIEEDEWW